MHLLRVCVLLPIIGMGFEPVSRNVPKDQQVSIFTPEFWGTFTGSFGLGKPLGVPNWAFKAVGNRARPKMLFFGLAFVTPVSAPTLCGRLLLAPTQRTR